jgi:hypothetical protein
MFHLEFNFISTNIRKIFENYKSLYSEYLRYAESIPNTTINIIPKLFILFYFRAKNY